LHSGNEASRSNHAAIWSVGYIHRPEAKRRQVAALQNRSPELHSGNEASTRNPELHSGNEASTRNPELHSGNEASRSDHAAVWSVGYIQRPKAKQPQVAALQGWSPELHSGNEATHSNHIAAIQTAAGTHHRRAKRRQVAALQNGAARRTFGVRWPDSALLLA
jgi:hypothetical protein